MSDSIEDNKFKIEKVIPKAEKNGTPPATNVTDSAFIKKEAQSEVDPGEFEMKPNKKNNNLRVKQEEGMAGVRVKEDPEDNKKGIKRVQEVYRRLSPVVTKRKRGKKDQDKTFTVTESGDEAEGVDEDHYRNSSGSGDEMEDREEIMINFVGNEQAWGRRREQRIRVMEYASLSMAFKEYATRIDKSLSFYTLRFLWDGQRLDGERAAADYGLANGDQIDVFNFQNGGHGIGNAQ